MSNDLAPIGAIAELDTRQYSQDVAKFIRDSERVDDALTDMVQSAARAEKAINDIKGNVDFKVGVDDSDLDTAKRKHDDLDANTAFVAGVDDSEVTKLLEQIRGLSVIDIALNFTGAGVGLLSGLFDLTGIPMIVQLDTAQMRIQGATGRAAPAGLVEMILSIYQQSFGDNIPEIAAAFENAMVLGVADADLEDAVLSAFQVAQVTGKDLTTVLRTQSRMVNTDLSPSYRAAADVLVTGFQRGVNAGDDLFDTFTEYSNDFKMLGLSAEEALNTMSSGMAGGFENSDRVADNLRELKIRILDLGDDAAQQALSALDFEMADSALETLDMVDARDAFVAGEITGAEFLSGITTALAAIEDPLLQQQLTAALYGTLSEDYGAQASLAIDPLLEGFVEVEDAAGRASDAISSDLGTLFSGAKRTFQTEAAEYFNEQFDIDQILEDVRNGIKTFFDELEAGTGLFASIEIALGVDGIDEFIDNFILGVMEMGINLLSFIRDVNTVLGRDTSSQERGIESIGRTAFEYRINTADTFGDVNDAVQQALDRGVEASDIETIIGNKISNAIEDNRVELADMLIAGAGIALRTDIAPSSMESGDLLNSQRLGVGAESISPLTGLPSAFVFPQQNAQLEALREMNVLAQSAADALTSGLIIGASEAKSIGNALMPILDARTARGDVGENRPRTSIGESAIDLATVNEEFTTLVDNVHGFTPVLEAAQPTGDWWLSFNEGLLETITSTGNAETSMAGLGDTGTGVFDTLGGGWLTFNDTFGAGVDTLDGNVTRAMEILANLQLAAFNANIAIAGAGGGVSNTTNNLSVTTNNPAAASAAAAQVAEAIRVP